MTIQEAMQLAQRHQQAGRHADTENICRLVISQIPDDCAVHSDLSKYLCDLGRFDLAISEAQRAIHLKPDFASAHYNLGVALNAAGRMDEAIGAFSRTVQLLPDFAEGFNNLGAALNARGRFDEAIAALSHAVQLKADYVRAYNNLGLALRGAYRLDDAIAAFNRAINLKGDFAEAMGNLGIALSEKGDLDGAIVAYSQSLKIQPRAFEVHNNLAVALIDKSRIEDAITECRRAIELKPDYADAHMNLAHAYLLTADFPRGWAEHQWRWKASPPIAPAITAKPRWAGEELHGKRILLYADQAFGDTIQFVRYADLVAQRGGKVIVGCPAPLVRLLSQSPGVEQVADINRSLPDFDLHCSLFDLSRLFATDLNSIPASIPYVTAENNLIEKWKTRLGPRRDLQRVGLVWAGTQRQIFGRNRNRSISLSQLAPLAGLKGVEFHSLQKGEASQQVPPAGLKLIDFTADLHDFADTAALIANLDLVISIDTSVAHLAGAIGKPVWLLLPFAADWRWMLAREDSPWYPTMRLFRQSQMGDWEGVIQSVVLTLQSTKAP